MACDLRFCGCPRQDSNLRSRLRRAVLYPLSYGGQGGAQITSRDPRCRTRSSGERTA
jgi:hypothetical protein